MEETIIQDEPKDGKNIIIMLIVIVGLFLIIIGSFKLYNAYYSEPEILSVDEFHQKNLEGKLSEDIGYIYKGYSFVYVDGLWWTKVQIDNVLKNVPLHYGPRELEYINITGKLDSEFDKKDKVNIAIDPTVNYNKYYTLALMELNNNVVQGFNREIEGSCTMNHSVCVNRTIVNCDYPLDKAVIELRLANESEIIFNNTCILIKGSSLELPKSVNRLIYYWYGIMD
jgi:hypothetical protein